MLHIVQRWKVHLTWRDRQLDIWVNEDHLSNVFRKLADLQFSETGLDQPIRIQIEFVERV